MAQLKVRSAGERQVQLPWLACRLACLFPAVSSPLDAGKRSAINLALHMVQDQGRHEGN